MKKTRLIFPAACLIIAMAGSVVGQIPESGGNADYRFDKNGISRKALENYLKRSVTLTELLAVDSLVNDAPFSGKEDDLRFIRNVGAKFIGRATYRWGREAVLNDPRFIEGAKDIARKIHSDDPDVVLQACLFENVTREVEEIEIPDWVFETANRPVESRTFRYEDMLDADGKHVDHWKKGASIPDITRPESKLWFLFLAGLYMEMGCEALHIGQIHYIGMNDPDWKHFEDVILRIRKTAEKKTRRGWVLLDAHTRLGGMHVDGRSLLDFNARPLRIKEIPEEPMKAKLEVGYSDSLYGGGSKGCVTPSGWGCDSLPYLVEFDNFNVSETPGRPTLDRHFIWGYDEISWLFLQNEEYRKEWLWYAHAWVRAHDPAAYVQMPAGRVVTLEGRRLFRFRANTRSEFAPEGLNLEETIKAVFSTW